MTRFATSEQFAAAGQANIDTMLSLAKAALGHTDRLTALSLNTARNAMEQGVASTQALLSAKDAQELAGLQSTLAQPMVDQLVSYASGVCEIALEAQSEIAVLFEAKLAEVNEVVVGALDEAAKAAPAGSETAFAAARSAVAAANSMYEGVSQAARQAAEIAEANAAAAAKAKPARGKKVA